MEYRRQDFGENQNPRKSRAGLLCACEFRNVLRHEPEEKQLPLAGRKTGTFTEWANPVPAEVNTLTACWTFEEKFSFEAGSTYYFNLSDAGIPGSANTDFYGGSLDCVPFTYAGTVDTYAQKDGSSAGVNGSRSLLVANYK